MDPSGNQNPSPIAQPLHLHWPYAYTTTPACITVATVVRTLVLVPCTRLQITTVLLSKYRSTVPGGELVPLLSVLCQLLSEQRRGERGAYVLGCLRELARCPAAHQDRASESRAELDRLWGRVWTLALRAVGSAQTEALSLGLLTSIIRAGLLSMDRESWKLFSGMACKPSQ